MSNIITSFLLSTVMLLTACSYHNQSIRLFPEADKQSRKDDNNHDLFLGNIATLNMNESDRFKLNRIFERKASFQEALWPNNTMKRDYLIILRPAYRNRSTKGVCRSAEIFPQGGGKTDKLFIIGCRNEYGQWQLLYPQGKRR